MNHNNKPNMKTKVIANFPTKREAFEWVISHLEDGTIGDINTRYNYEGFYCVYSETETIIYLGIYDNNI